MIHVLQPSLEGQTLLKRRCMAVWKGWINYFKGFLIGFFRYISLNIQECYSATVEHSTLKSAAWLSSGQTVNVRCIIQ
jgi:hypothetical protein